MKTKKFFLLSIDNTSNAAFSLGNKEVEVARLINLAATRLEQGNDSAALMDGNGNAVGTMRMASDFPAEAVDPGKILLEFDTDTAAFIDNGAEWESARILRDVARRVENGDRDIVLRDNNGGAIGNFTWQPEPSLECDGKIDLQSALGEGRVYMADSGYNGPAEDEYHLVVTGPDFEPGYEQGEGEVWLVNIEGEIASGYPTTLRENVFEALKSDELSAIKAVLDGSLSAEDYNRRFADDSDQGLDLS